MLETQIKLDLSIVVCTYNSSWEKIEFTLDSLITTKNCRFEIIVCDDGSEINHFDRIKNYFSSNEFSKYQLLSQPINKGLVYNAYEGIVNAKGTWIKLISPGDAMAGDDILAEWIQFNVYNKFQWSFGRALYYNASDESTPKIGNIKDHPVDLSPYIKEKRDVCRWNYVVLSDFALGANTLCLRQLLLSYFNEIKGKVVYAEDNIYRLMMFDDVPFGFYPHWTIKYEYGSGISTSGSEKWGKRLHDDIISTDTILHNRKNQSEYQQKMLKSYEEWSNADGFRRRLIYAIKNKGLVIWLKRKGFLSNNKFNR